MSDVCMCGLNPPHKVSEHAKVLELVKRLEQETNAHITTEHSHSESCGCGHAHEHSHTHEHAHSHEHAHEHNHAHAHSHAHVHSGEACSAECGCEHSHGTGKGEIIRFSLSAVFFALGFVLFKLLPAPVVLGRFGFGHFAFLISWLLSGYKVLGISAKNISHGSVFDENFLMSIASIGAFFLGEFGEAAAVMLFYNLGEIVQHRAVENSTKSILSLMDLKAEFARIISTDGVETLVDPEQVKIGSTVLVKSGERVPIDGIIEKGSASFDTSSMTGESLPRNLSVGDKVLGGFVNIDGLLEIKTTANLEETASAKMLHLIKESQSRKAPVERFITKFARVYTPIVVISAVFLAVLPPVILALFFNTPIVGFSSFATWVSRALVFLVISCPCALVLSVPLGYFAGIGGAAKRGILVKGADYIDVLAKTKAVVFDKTGTLTTGKLAVADILPSETATVSQLLELASIAEKNSNHPIAKAIIEKAKSENISVSDGITDYTEVSGKGVKMQYAQKELFVGNADFIQTSILTATNFTKPAESQLLGKTTVYVSYDSKYIGCITLKDNPKPTSGKAIQLLKKIGITNIEMLTGDSENSARVIADKLNIANYSAELLPHEKVARFEQITDEVKAQNKKHAVLFVGDGINDAPVLARADVGIAMGALGSDAAIEAADIVLMNDRPDLIPEAVSHAKYTKRIVLQNIAFTLLVKFSFLALGAFGLIGMESAIFADVGVTLIAVLNALRARR